MHIFVTGGTGYIGRGLVRHLLENGHQVTALVRSSTGEARIKQLGARAEYGDLRQAAAYGRIAAEHDAIVHLALESGAEAASADRAAVGGLLDALRSAPRPRVFLYTSGVWVLGPTGERAVGEDASTRAAAAAVAWRPGQEKLVLEAGSPTEATSVIRPGIVYGGRGGLLGFFFRSALHEGAAVHVGNGANRWPLVHRDDLVRLYRMIIEKRARGIFHGVDGSSATVRELAGAASRAAGKGGAVRSTPLELARRTMGDLADALCLDQRVRARRSAELGWRTQRRTFLESAEEVFQEWCG